MLNVIVLDSVENEIARRKIAHKIMTTRTNTPYTQLLQQLRVGGVEFISTEDKKVLESATFELKKLGVKYRIIQRALPEKPERIERTQVLPQTPLETPVEENKYADRPKTQFVPKVRVTQNIRLIDDPIDDNADERHTMELAAARRRNIFAMILMTTILASVVITLYILAQNKPTYRLQKQPFISTSTVSSQRQGRTGGGGETSQTAQQVQTPREIQYSQALDEAENACIEGAIDMEKLYRTAISFNKQNLQAWLGLLDCFERMGDERKSAEVQREMQELFGAAVFSILEIIANYGVIESFSVQGTAGRLSYFRSAVSEPAERELFLIGQGIAETRRFSKAAIFAKNCPNSGYMVSYSLVNFPKTFEEFLQKIVVNKVGH